jgi:integrase
MLKLIPPGKRKGNTHWIARGRVAGRLIEITTGEIDKGRAEVFAADAYAKLLKNRAPAVIEPPPDPEIKTFRTAASAYVAWRNPGWTEIQRINRLVADLGDHDAKTITNADLVASAARLYPDAKASSKNRSVITIASAILHYASEQGWCGYLRIRRFKEPRPETRALRPEPAQALIRSAGDLDLIWERAFLIFLFAQGMRVSDSLSVEWERINLREGLIEVRIAKTDSWRWKALDPDARAALAALPLPEGKTERSGKVWPWSTAGRSTSA